MAYNPKGARSGGGFNRGGSRGGGAGFSARKPWAKGGRGNDRGDRGGRGFDSDREMFEATCASCHEACEVPFRPSAGKPVYCRKCFAQAGGDEGRSNRSFAPRRQDDRRDSRSHEHAPQHDEVRAQLEKINAKMDRLIELMSANATEATEALGYIAAKKAKKKAMKKAIDKATKTTEE